MRGSGTRAERSWRVAEEVPLRTLVMGHGPPVLLFHGFAMRPELYASTASCIATSGRTVICPDLFSLRGAWHAESVVKAIAETAERLGCQQALMVAHSFGGGPQLDLAVAYPELVGSLVFADTLGLSREMKLAREAAHPTTLIRLATREASLSFARSALEHPVRLARAAWWGFSSDREDRASLIARRGVACYVIWAERDTLLPRSEGEGFARSLGASFHILSGEGVGPIDHDAMFRHPQQFVQKLAQIGALRAAPVAN